MNPPLSYLEKYRESLNWDALVSLKKERDFWRHRPSVQSLFKDIEFLPKVSNVNLDLLDGTVRIGKASDLSSEQHNLIHSWAKRLTPWRKGPFSVFGLDIDSEWRSHFKWARLQKHLGTVEGEKVLDIGCNNGFYLFHLAAQNPELLLGIDPTLTYAAQFNFLNHFACLQNTFFELWGVEHVPYFKDFFDTIFLMGILYHHRGPQDLLTHLREALRPGGRVFIETIGIPGEESLALFPKDRYAGMSNVWFLPTLSCLVNWLERAKFVEIEVLSQTWEEVQEQRKTIWSDGPSYQEFLHPEDSKKTIEGHPAPKRFLLLAKKKSYSYRKPSYEKTK